MTMLLAVALGGALGAVGRYFVISWVGHRLKTDFPLGTLAVNISGSFALGLLIGLMANAWAPAPEIRAFATVGILGAFTTFSTFALDVAFLAERHRSGLAAAYALASVGLSVGAFAASLALTSVVVLKFL
jgi:CrcB protein